MKTILILSVLCTAALASPETRTVLEKPGEAHMLNGVPYQGSPWIRNATPQEMAERAGLIFITEQEATAAIKAMEIFESAAGKMFYRPLPSPMTIDAIYRPFGSTEDPAELRARANQIEAEQAQAKKEAADFTWARGVLEAWKKKVEECK